MAEPGGEGLYRLLLRVLPPGFRREAESELRALFRAARAAARPGLGGRIAFWSRMVADLALTAALEWGATLAPSLPGSGRWSTAGAQAVRRLRRRPLRTIGGSTALGVGIAAAVVGMALVRTILLAPLPFAEPERLVRLIEVDESGRTWWPSWPNFSDWRQEGDAIFAGVGLAEAANPRPVLWGGQGARARVGAFSRGFLEVLGVDVARGRAFSDDENTPGGPGAAIVSDAFWRARLGAADLPGLVLTIGTERFPVVGVLPPDFRFLIDGGGWDEADVWLPFERRTAYPQRQSHGYHVVGRLAQGVTLDRARSDMDLLATRLRAAHGEETQAHRVRLTSLHADIVGPARATVDTLFRAAALVLLVACFNLSGSLLADGLGRGRELSVRAAVGARRGDLAAQVLGEATLLALPGAVLGAALAQGVVALLRRGGFSSIPRLGELRIDGELLVVAGGLALGTAVVAGLAPALFLGLRDVAGRLRSGTGTTPPRHQKALWSGAVATQTGVTLVLLFVAGLFLRSFANAVNVDVGYDPEGVTAASVALPPALYPPDRMLPFHEEALARIAALPGVTAVGVTNVLPHVTQALTATARRVGAPEEATGWSAYRLVDSGYFEALRIPLVRGEAFRDGSGEGWIDATLQDRLWDGDEPVGDEVRSYLAEEPVRVAGVVGPVREWQMAEPAVGTVYVDFRSRPGALGELHFLVRGGASPNTLRRVFADLDPQVPVEVRPLESERATTRAEQRLLLWIAGAFAAVALFLSGVALHAVVAFVAEQRRREAGIRLALGAGMAQVRAGVLRHALVPSAVGAAVGLAATWPAGQLIETQLFGVSATDPTVATAATLALLAAAALAVGRPARRLGRVDPVTVMRAE